MKKNKTTTFKKKILEDSCLGTGALAIGASTLAAPAITAERKEIIMVMTWPENFPGLGVGAARFAKRVTEMSGGRLNVTLYQQENGLEHLTHLTMLLLEKHKFIMELNIIGQQKILLTDISVQYRLV